jgi:hypothetical protein
MEEGRPRDALVPLRMARYRANLNWAWHAGALGQGGLIEEAFVRLEAALGAGYRDAGDLRNLRWHELGRNCLAL